MLTKNDLFQITEIVRNEICKETIPLRKSQKKIEKKLDLTISFFDQSWVNLNKRVIKLESVVR